MKVSPFAVMALGCKCPSLHHLRVTVADILIYLHLQLWMSPEFLPEALLLLLIIHLLMPLEYLPEVDLRVNHLWYLHLVIGMFSIPKGRGVVFLLIHHFLLPLMLPEVSKVRS